MTNTLINLINAMAVFIIASAAVGILLILINSAKDIAFSLLMIFLVALTIGITHFLH
jgi:hypothetical protein